MDWKLKVARLLGIDVFVHWSFFLWLVFVFQRDYLASGVSGGSTLCSSRSPSSPAC